MVPDDYTSHDDDSQPEGFGWLSNDVDIDADDSVKAAEDVVSGLGTSSELAPELPAMPEFVRKRLSSHLDMINANIARTNINLASCKDEIAQIRQPILDQEKRLPNFVQDPSETKEINDEIAALERKLAADSDYITLCDRRRAYITDKISFSRDRDQLQKFLDAFDSTDEK